MHSELAEHIEELLDEGSVETSPSERYVFRTDTTKFKGDADIVVNVTGEKEISRIVAFASENSIPVIPRGAGSGMSGGAVPLKGGIVLNFELMNKILRIDKKKKLAFVQPGAVTDDIRKRAESMGLYYPPDPSSSNISTIGGNVSENAGGLHCVKYGVTAKYVKGFKFINSSGRLVKWGIYDPEHPHPGTAVMIGSEGTLGIITEIALRLIDFPYLKESYISFHDSVLSAVNTVIKIKSQNIDPSVVEMIDGLALEGALKFSDIEIPDNTCAVLLIKLDGHFLPDLTERVARLENILSFMKAKEFRKAKDEKEEVSFWSVRKAVSSSIKKLSPDKINEDITVPLSTMNAYVSAVHEIAQKYDLRIIIYGHAGDGNLHVNILYDKNNENLTRRARLASEEIFRNAVESGGNITGEHGIGISKKNFLSIQYSKNEIGFMKKIKKVFDPGNIINPDKIFNISKGS